MCVGLPGRIVSIRANSATVDIWGVVMDVRLDALDEQVRPGDFIIEHAGMAVRRLAPEEVEDTLSVYETLLTESAQYPCSSVFLDDIEIEIPELQPV